MVFRFSIVSRWLMTSTFQTSLFWTSLLHRSFDVWDGLRLVRRTTRNNLVTTVWQTMTPTADYYDCVAHFTKLTKHWTLAFLLGKWQLWTSRETSIRCGVNIPLKCYHRPFPRDAQLDDTFARAPKTDSFSLFNGDVSHANIKPTLHIDCARVWDLKQKKNKESK